MRLTRLPASGLRKILTVFLLAGLIGAFLPAPQAFAETKQKTQHSVKKSPAKKAPVNNTAGKKATAQKSAGKKPTGKKAPGKRAAATRKAAIPAHASIVVDSATGTILSQSNADAAVHPASLTKMMTLLLVFERLENNSISLSQRLEVSNHAASQPPSKLDLPAGSSIELQNAIYAVVTKSANDMAVTIAENIGGSEGHFVYLMNEKAKALGMTQTRFMNPSGLHHPSQVTTARDWAKLSRYIIRAYPREYKYFATKSFTYRGVANRNHNRLMETYAGMDGIKTGFIQPSGFNLAASAVRRNNRLIAIVFGGPTAQTRNNEVAALLNDGFAKLGTPRQPKAPVSQTLVSQAEPVPLDPRLSTIGGTASLPTPASPPALPPASTPASILPQQQQIIALAPQTQTQIQTPTLPQPARPAILVTTADPAPSVQVPQTRAMTGAMTGTMAELAGQGDSDPAITRRFETGMTAIAAVKTTLKPGETSVAPSIPGQIALQPAPYNPAGAPTPQVLGNNDWAIQLGSYASRVKSDEALTAAIARLPAAMRGTANPVIVPLKAGDGWVYRARLRGFSQGQATSACQYFTHCLPISPRAF